MRTLPDAIYEPIAAMGAELGWRLAYFTGARLRDVANMRWNAIDLERQILIFTPSKTKKPVTIPLRSELERQLLKSPGVGKALKDARSAGQAVDEKQFKRIEAIIQSMTAEERRRPEILGGSRKKRIAGGSGTSAAEINQLLTQFRQMQAMMKQLTGGMPGLRGLGGGLAGLGKGLPGSLPGLGNGVPAEVPALTAGASGGAAAARAAAALRWAIAGEWPGLARGFGGADGRVTPRAACRTAAASALP